MHLGNEALTPECAALFTGVAAVGLAAAAWSARREPATPYRWQAAGIYGGAIFAAQMVNVPLLPYSSGHLVGGVLLAAALGPGLGAITMALVLAIQAICLGDGGLSSLGANITNMALIPAGLVALARGGLVADLPAWSKAFRLGTLATLSVLLAAALIVFQVVLFRSDITAMPAFAREMLQAHLVIGLAEGVLTAIVAYAVAGEWIGRDARQFGRRAAGVTAAALLLLVLGLPLASALPDGYEASAERSGWEQLLADSTSSLAVWQSQLAAQVEQSLRYEPLIALATTLLAAAVCLVVARLVSRSQPASHA